MFDFGENKRQPVRLSNKGWNAGLTNWNNILGPRRPVLKMFGTCLVENILCCVFVMDPSVMFITSYKYSFLVKSIFSISQLHILRFNNISGILLNCVELLNCTIVLWLHFKDC